MVKLILFTSDRWDYEVFQGLTFGRDFASSRACNDTIPPNGKRLCSTLFLIRPIEYDTIGIVKFKSSVTAWTIWNMRRSCRSEYKIQNLAEKTPEKVKNELFTKDLSDHNLRNYQIVGTNHWAFNDTNRFVSLSRRHYNQNKTSCDVSNTYAMFYSVLKTKLMCYGK